MPHIQRTYKQTSRRVDALLFATSFKTADTSGIRANITKDQCTEPGQKRSKKHSRHDLLATMAMAEPGAWATWLNQGS